MSKMEKRSKHLNTPRKIYRRQLNVWKDSQHHQSIGICKFELQGDINYAAAEMAQIKKSHNTKC